MALHFKSIILRDGNAVFNRNNEILCEVLDEEGLEAHAYISENQLLGLGIDIPKSPKKIETIANNNSNWSDGATSFLLEKYAQYLPKVGPMKMFQKKKDLWIQISNDLLKELNESKSFIQVENRYKTIIKRKKNAIDHNNISGNSRMNVPFENEIKMITGIDDSIEPEVLRNSNKVNIIKKHHMPEGIEEKHIKKKKAITNIADTLMEIQKMKEEAKERRHREKMELIERLLGGNNNPNGKKDEAA